MTRDENTLEHRSADHPTKTRLLLDPHPRQVGIDDVT
jgi:hypothetical protein